MEDRRDAIIDAGLAILREQGYAGFTQPRIASRVGMRQSHLTYYYPTRLDLLTAVAKAAVDRQLAFISQALCNVNTIEQLSTVLADAVCRHENTRTLLAAAEASDAEPTLNWLFSNLVGGFIACAEPALRRLGVKVEVSEAARLLQTVVVGLAVVEFASRRKDARHHALMVLSRLLTGLCPESAPEAEDLRHVNLKEET